MASKKTWKRRAKEADNEATLRRREAKLAWRDLDNVAASERELEVQVTRLQAEVAHWRAEAEAKEPVLRAAFLDGLNTPGVYVPMPEQQEVWQASRTYKALRALVAKEAADAASSTLQVLEILRSRATAGMREEAAPAPKVKTALPAAWQESVEPDDVVYIVDLCEGQAVHELLTTCGDIGPFTEVRSPGTVFFIDHDPRAAWPHDCTWAFACDDGNVINAEMQWPPRALTRQLQPDPEVPDAAV